MRPTPLAVPTICLLAALTACSGRADNGLATEGDAGDIDTAIDGSDAGADSGADSDADPDDAAPDARPDAQPDAAPDAPLDGPLDAPSDAPSDAPPDAPADTGPADADAGSDAGADAFDTDTDASVEPPIAGRPPRGTPTEYFVAAHQDDDLLFMSPDLLHAVRSGGAVRTLFVTGGDACRTRDPALREAGIRAAYALMLTGEASADEGWECGRHDVAEVPVLVCELAGATHLSTVFVRLPDCGPALASLWDGATLETVDDPATSLDRAALIGLLSDELEAVEPLAVHTLDASDVYGHDHSDHIASARLAYEAARSVGAAGAYREHRTYNMDGDPANVPSADLEAKWAAVAAYCEPSAEGAHCARGSGVAFWEWTRRQYVSRRVDWPAGRLGTTAGCLAERDGLAVLAPCEGAPPVEARGWSLRRGETCLRASGDALRWGACDGSPEARFAAMSDGQLRHSAGRCLSGAGGALRVEACAAADGGAPAPAQTWSRRVGPVVRYPLFDDAALDRSGVRSFALADVDGDRTPDACIRATEGIVCALGDGSGGFGVPALWSAAFADAEGWLAEARDATVRFGDLDGDGADDVCGRGVAGLLCAISDGSAFGPLALVSSGGDFADSETDRWFEPAWWGALALVDVDRDGTADACARTSEGPACARSTGGTLGPRTSLGVEEFTDALGWGAAPYGATLRFGDVDGDGALDACGRGAAGMICAFGADDGLVAPRFAGFREELADASGWPAREQFYASLALVDVDADGADDVCIRRPDGIACGLSTGRAFGRLLPFGGFSDEDGFGTETHGGSLRWGDVDGDGVVDPCARHAEGLRCALSR